MDYLTGGLYPFMLEEGGALDLFGNIVEKVVRSDLPACDPNLTGVDVANMERLLRFVGRSPIDGINYTSLARNLAITKYKAEHYVHALERASLLRQAFRREPTCCVSPRCSWSRRFASCTSHTTTASARCARTSLPWRWRNMACRSATPSRPRGAKTPDFLVTLDDLDHVIEVGGRGKGRSQFKGLTYDHKVVLFHGDDQRHTPAPASRCTASASPERVAGVVRRTPRAAPRCRGRHGRRAVRELDNARECTMVGWLQAHSEEAGMSRNVRTGIALGAVLILAAPVLWAGGRGEGSVPEGPAEIVAWLRGGPGGVEWFERNAQEYMEAHPQVTLRMEHQGGSHSDYGAKLRLSHRAGTGPDIIHEPHDVNLTSLMSAGFTAPPRTTSWRSSKRRRSPRTR